MNILLKIRSDDKIAFWPQQDKINNSGKLFAMSARSDRCLCEKIILILYRFYAHRRFVSNGAFVIVELRHVG